ncbi:ribonuclease H1 isoform X2 [Nelusetta ayraudi]
MAKGKFFYAVRKGFKPGVYASWDECKSQVVKFPAAQFKKFGSEKDAWAFVRGAAAPAVPEVNPAQSVESAVVPLPRRGPEPLEYIPLGRKRGHQEEEGAEPQPHSKRGKPSGSSAASSESSAASSGSSASSSESSAASSGSSASSSGSSASSGSSPDGFTYMGDAVVVYTDGCCSANGKKGARAGIGVYWGCNHPLNVAERLQGRQTNQRAEIQAACRALQQARQKKIQKLIIYTDSMFTINGVTKWVKKWKLNNWQLKSGGPVVNKDDFVLLDRLNQQLKVVWMHIPGHAGYSGNEQADRLSREGAAKTDVKLSEGPDEYDTD